MNVLTVILVFSVLMGVVAFAAGLVLSVRLLRVPGGGAGTAPVGTQLGAVLLVGIGGALVGTAMVTAALVTEREADLIQMQSVVNQLEAKVRVYEQGITRLEKSVEASKAAKGSADRLAAEVHQELKDLRQRRTAIR